MPAILAVAFVVGVITACVGPLYYCKKSAESREHPTDEPSETDSPLVRIKISHPRNDNVLTHDACNNGQGFVESNDDEHADKIMREVRPRVEENSKIVPVKPPRKRRNLRVDHSEDSSNREPSKKPILWNGRSAANIWSPSLRNQLENLTNSSSEAYVVTKVVRGQIERRPKVSMSTNNETVDTFRKPSLQQKDVNSIDPLSSEEDCPKDERGKKLSSVVAKKWRNLKGKLMSSRFKKPTLSENIEDVETQGSNRPIPASRQRSPVDRTVMLRKDRLVDASTSTRISSNVADAKKRRNEDEGSDGNDDLSNSQREVWQDVASMIQRRSANGKSLCDVQITGLSMDQSELLDLFEASGGKSHSASIVTTEEASVICIKFHHRRNVNSEDLPPRNPLVKLYRDLSDKFADVTFSRLFRSQEQSGSYYYSTCVNSPRNETSYTDLPNFGINVRADQFPVVEGRNS